MARKHTHYGTLTTRPATPAEVAINIAWATTPAQMTNIGNVTENFCACGVRL